MDTIEMAQRTKSILPDKVEISVYLIFQRIADAVKIAGRVMGSQSSNDCGNPLMILKTNPRTYEANRKPRSILCPVLNSLALRIIAHNKTQDAANCRKRDRSIAGKESGPMDSISAGICISASITTATLAHCK